LNKAGSSTITVDYITSDITATIDDNDYTGIESATLTFEQGDTHKIISVKTTDDNNFEDDESLYINLLNPTGAPVSDGYGIGTIRNDDLCNDQSELNASSNLLVIGDRLILKAVSGGTNYTWRGPGIGDTTTGTTDSLIINNVSSSDSGRYFVTVTFEEQGSDFKCGDNVSYGGENYSTVKIGDQCWFAENLNVTNGNTDQEFTISRRCIDCSTYGGLYDWYEAMCGSSEAGAQGICPAGWHIPTHDEITDLERQICLDIGESNCSEDFPKDNETTGFTGLNNGNGDGVGSAIAGKCDTWTDDHLDNSGNCDNDFGASGFNLPAGGKYDSIVMEENERAYFWSSSEYGSNAWRRFIDKDKTYIHRQKNDKYQEMSIRCLKNDAESCSTYDSVDVAVTKVITSISNKGEYSEPKIYYDANGNIVIIQSNGNEWSLYSLEGKQVLSGKSDNIVPLNQIPTGMYFLRIGQKSFKVLNKK